MNIIVDTTIWSKYFRRKYHDQNLEIISEMSKLIEDQKVVIIGPIRQELLSGISNNLVSRKILGSFIEKSISTHGLNNIAKHPHMLQFR